LKKIECVETPNEYDDIIRSARNPPFLLRHGVVNDFESALKPYFVKMNIEISKACVMIFRIDGTVEVHQNNTRMMNDGAALDIKRLIQNLLIILYCVKK